MWVIDMQINNLDVWAVQKKEELEKAISIIDKDSIGNILYSNCICTFVIGDRVITEKLFDKCFYSEDSDAVIFFSSDKISSEDIEEQLNKHNVNYTIVSFKERKKTIQGDDSFPEVWFARADDVLKEAIDNSVEKSIMDCVYYPEMESRLILGYKTIDNRRSEIEYKMCRGVVYFKDKIILLISQNDNRNVSVEQVKRILKNKGINYEIKKGLRGR